MRLKEYLKDLLIPDKQLNEEDLFEMSNLTKDETGLELTVWVSVKQHSSGPRVKVNFDSSLTFDKGNNFSVSISNEPFVVAGGTEKEIKKRIGAKKLDDVYDWVAQNSEVLLKYCNDEISTKKMTDEIKELK